MYECGVCVCVCAQVVHSGLSVGRGERTLNAVNAFTGVHTAITSQSSTYVYTYVPTYVRTYACAITATLDFCSLDYVALCDKPTYPPV